MNGECVLLVGFTGNVLQVQKLSHSIKSNMVETNQEVGEFKPKFSGFSSFLVTTSMLYQCVVFSQCWFRSLTTTVSASIFIGHIFILSSSAGYNRLKI